MVGGPTLLPPEVSAAGALPVFDERTDEFAHLFRRLTGRLQHVLGTQGDVLTFAASATGAQESAVQNLLSPGDGVLVASNGFYGERWSEMCSAFGLKVEHIEAPWGSPLDLDRVRQAVRDNPSIVAAFAVHSESSTGMLNDLAAFAEAVGDRLVVIDAVASVGAVPINADRCGVDVAVGASQKALMAPPGLSFVSVSDAAWKKVETARLPRYYFDWRAARRAYDEAAITPFTPAVGLIVQFDRAVDLVMAEGLPAITDRHALVGRVLRAGCRALGLEPLSDDASASPTMTALRLPDAISGRDLVSRLVTCHGVQVAAGNGEWADRLLRVGHAGEVDVFDAVSVVTAVELVLREVGLEPTPGAAAVAVQEVMRCATRGNDDG